MDALCAAPAPAAAPDRSRALLLAVPAAGIAAGLALAIPRAQWALLAAAAVLGWTQLAGP